MFNARRFTRSSVSTGKTITDPRLTNGAVNLATYDCGEALITLMEISTRTENRVIETCWRLKIKATLFDLGNTLVYSRPEETFHKILAEHGITRSLDDIRRALIVGNKEFDIDKHVEMSAHEFYTKWNLVHLKHLGIRGEEALKLAEELAVEWFDYGEFYVYPDVRKTLQKLRQMRFKTGIITGGFTDDIARILPKVDLVGFFDVYVGVDTTRKRKPHPDAFKCALKQLRVMPHEAVFVGDDYEADYLGAQGVGIIPVLIKRKKPSTQALQTDVRAQLSSGVRTIMRLDEIFKVLEEINA